MQSTLAFTKQKKKGINIMKSDLTFSEALVELKAGNKVCRSGWNGKGMYVGFVPATQELNAHFRIKNVNGSFSTWVPSINDVLAEDWQILGEV